MAFFPLLTLGASLALLVFIVYLAIAVQNDAAARSRTNRELFLIGHWGWFFIIIFTGGFIGTFVYWIIHYSALRYSPRAGETTEGRSTL